MTISMVISIDVAIILVLPINSISCTTHSPNLITNGAIRLPKNMYNKEYCDSDTTSTGHYNRNKIIQKNYLAQIFEKIEAISLPSVGSGIPDS